MKKELLLCLSAGSRYSPTRGIKKRNITPRTENTNHIFYIHFLFHFKWSIVKDKYDYCKIKDWKGQCVNSWLCSYHFRICCLFVSGQRRAFAISGERTVLIFTKNDNIQNRLLSGSYPFFLGLRFDSLNVYFSRSIWQMKRWNIQCLHLYCMWFHLRCKIRSICILQYK